MTGAGLADLAHLTLVVAATTMGAICLNVRTSETTASCASGASTGAARADAAYRTGLTTSTTIVWVRREVTTGAIATSRARGTGGRTLLAFDAGHKKIVTSTGGRKWEDVFAL